MNNNNDIVEDYLSKYYLGKLEIISDIIKLIKNKDVSSYQDYIYVTSGIMYCSTQLYYISEYLESSYDLPDNDYISYQIFVLEEELKLIEV